MQCNRNRNRTIIHMYKLVGYHIIVCAVAVIWGLSSASLDSRTVCRHRIYPSISINDGTGYRPKWTLEKKRGEEQQQQQQQLTVYRWKHFTNNGSSGDVGSNNIIHPSELFSWLIGSVCHIYRRTLMDNRIRLGKSGKHTKQCAGTWESTFRNQKKRKKKKNTHAAIEHNVQLSRDKSKVSKWVEQTATHRQQSEWEINTFRLKRFFILDNCNYKAYSFFPL